MTRWTLAAALVVGASTWIGACGSSDGEGKNGAATGDGGVPTDAFAQFAGDASEQPIEIVPGNPVLTATGTPVTQAFKAVLVGTTDALAASWSADNAAIGYVNTGSGLFTANGTVGGVAHVTAQYGGRSATTTVTVKVALRDVDPQVSAADQAALDAGGPAANDSGFRWLYPYDKTVFPRGLRAPLLQFGGVAPDAMKVHVESQFFAYDGYFAASNPARVKLDEARWRSITQSAGGTDTVKVSVTKKSGAVVTGPVVETWTIAPASLKGTVYYNTYNTPQAGGSGALLKIRPGTTQDAEVFMGGCTVCHSVSANGNVIASGRSWNDSDPITSATFTVDGTGNVPRTAGGDAIPTYFEDYGKFAFGGLTPDGKYMMSHANGPGGLRGLSDKSGKDSALYDTTSGAQVAGVKGFTHAGAQMPSFSPDGKKLVFNNRDASSGKTLTVYDFDQTTLTFSNPVDVWTDDKLVAWPAFLPDARAVVFHTGNDFGTQTRSNPTDIELVDVASKTKVRLPALNGYDGTDAAFGATYLPYGESAEAHLNYEPTVLPVAAGGYYWVVFTSRRCYGNVFDDSFDAWGSTGNADELSPRKKLWVAAIDLAAKPGQDRSHPAFYLPGQETDTGNMRAFWALDACRNDGASCESGDECCNGFCRQVSDSDGAGGFVCTGAGAGCANEFEKCTTAADCCNSSSGVQCINGHCAVPAPK